MEENQDNGKTERLGPGQMPFSTTDAILAFSLCMAGVPFAEEGRPCLNIYDEPILKRMGFVGLDIFQAAEIAFSRKKKGHIEYGFRQVPELRGLLKMYMDQVQELEEGQGTPAELMKKIMGYFSKGEMDLQETLLRLACINAKMKTQFMSLWQKRDPIIRIRRQGHSETTRLGDGSIRVRKPGFVLVNLHASQETKDKLKI